MASWQKHLHSPSDVTTVYSFKKKTVIFVVYPWGSAEVQRSHILEHLHVTGMLFSRSPTSPLPIEIQMLTNLEMTLILG